METLGPAVWRMIPFSLGSATSFWGWGGLAPLFEIVLTSLRVSFASTAAATVIGVPAGFWIARRTFPGRGTVVTLLQTLMALPTVVVGLAVYGFLCRRGLFGASGLLFTRTAIVIGQFVLALPIVTALSMAAFRGLDPRVRETALSLGASEWQVILASIRETRFALAAAVAAGFGRVVAEVGVSMMLGGNIEGYTRTMTTAIALETSKGEFSLGIALGVILLTVVFSVTLLFQRLQARGA